MKQDTFFRVCWLIFGIVIASIVLFKMSRYLEARVAYEEQNCSDAAYMIYKGYDDQPEEVRTRDWLTRIDECATIGAEYQKSF